MTDEPAIPRKVTIWPLLALYALLILGGLIWVSGKALDNSHKLDDVLHMREARFEGDCQEDGKKLYECQYMWSQMKDKEMR